MRSSANPEAAFLAVMTASATHELRNVLAIVKESAGLIEDMVHAFGKKGTLDPEKLRRSVGRIDAQVKRGAELLTNLNNLAHTLDHDRATVDLHGKLEQMVELSQRLVRKSGQEIVLRTGRGKAEVTVSPLRLQMILFSVIELCMTHFPEGATITLESGSAPDGPAVEFRGEWDGEGEEDVHLLGTESWLAVEELARSLDAELEDVQEGVGGRIRFRGGPSER